MLGYLTIAIACTCSVWAETSVSSGNQCTNPGATKVIVDYDSNIDDVVALSYILKDPTFEVVAVICTATGFTTAGPGYDNTRRLLQLLGSNDIDVGLGPMYNVFEQQGWPGGCAYQSSVPRSSLLNANQLFGLHNTLLSYSPELWGPDTLDSATVYKTHVDAGVDTVLTLGPLTSLADFQTQHNDSFANIKHITAMFGAVDVPGNIFSRPSNNVSEFNAYLDPHAAKSVFSATSLESITLVPLDATNDVPMTAEYMAELAALTTPEGIFVSELTRLTKEGWFAGDDGFYGTGSGGLADAYFFWDPLAVAVMINSSIAAMTSANIEVVGDSSLQSMNHDQDGRTQVSGSGVSMRYASGVSAGNADYFRGHLIDMLQRDCIADQPLTLEQVVGVAAAYAASSESSYTAASSDSDSESGAGCATAAAAVPRSVHVCALMMALVVLLATVDVTLLLAR